MPWPEKQRRAIAANLRRKGKSPAEISDFFHKHGHRKKRGKARAKALASR